MDFKTINFIQKPIHEFRKSDTIYLTKIINGKIVQKLCKFEKFDKGKVIGIPIHKTKKKERLETRLTKCYLLGKEENNNCYLKYWFNTCGNIKI